MVAFMSYVFGTHLNKTKIKDKFSIISITSLNETYFSNLRPFGGCKDVIEMMQNSPPFPPSAT